MQQASGGWELADSIFDWIVRFLASGGWKPPDSRLSDGGLESEINEIKASGGWKPPNSMDIDHRSLCYVLTSRKRQRRTNNAQVNWIASFAVCLLNEPEASATDKSALGGRWQLILPKSHPDGLSIGG